MNNPANIVSNGNQTPATPLQHAGGKTRQLQGHQRELVELIENAIHHQDGKIEPIKGLHFNRLSSPVNAAHAVSVPCFCVIAQGSKEIFLGDKRFLYDPSHYLLISAKLPTVGCVLEASEERPYLSLRLELDPAVVSSVMMEAARAAPQSRADVKAVNVSGLDADLLDAVVRLARLVNAPAEAPFLAPLITREIVYRLWMGELGDRLRYIAASSGYTPFIIQAIKRLHQDFDQPLRIGTIAHEVGMSVSGFHHQFKAVTAMSPLQFQKRLRLQEARRLMLGEGLDAASAGYRVGYQDASHFNREYKDLFGLPPMRDVERLRETAQVNRVLRAE